MKLKNSYLLIVIAIFLLISIGSVCASENITDDSDAQLADDGTDVVLSDTDENVPDVTAEEPINTTVSTDDDKYEFKEDSNKTMTVEVKYNESSPINVNKENLSVKNGDKVIEFEYNSSIITITQKLATGNYNLTISYLGSANYTSSYKMVNVKIYGDTTIETQTSVVCNGKHIEVPVKIYDQVDYIEAIKSNFNLTLVYTNETGNVTNLTITEFDIDNDTIKFDTTVKLISASLIIDYANTTEPKTVGIKVSSEVKATQDEYKFKSEENKSISITIKDGQGNPLNVSKNDLKVFNNGTNITFEYNNSSITVELGVGTHNLTITYLGNETYNASSDDFVVKVSGNNTIETEEIVYSDGVTVEVPVKIFDGADYIALNENLTVTLTYTNETGNVTTKNVTYTIGEDKISFTADVKLISASITLNYTNAVETKTVAIRLITSTTAQADKEKYNIKENKTIAIKVLDSQSNALNITADDLKVVENGSDVAFTYNNSVITITSISEGAHNLTVIYKGNETYNASNTTVELNVYGANQIKVPEFVVSEDAETVEIPIYIFNGLENITIDAASLTLNLTYTNETGNVTVQVIDATAAYNDGKITFTADPLTKASLTIDYVDSTGAKIVKINLATIVNATPETNKYRNNETDNITVEVKGCDGKVVNITKNDLQVFDNGKSIAFTFNNSVINVNLEDGLHNLTIVFKGDDTYNSSSISIERRVYGDIRFNPDNTTVLDNNSQVTIAINLNDGVDPVEIDVNKLNVTVFWTIGNETQNKTVEVALNNQTITIDLPSDFDFDSAYAVINYADNNLTATTKIQVNTSIDVESEITKGETEDKTIQIIVNSNNEHVFNLTKDNLQILKDGKALTIEVNGSIVTIKDVLKPGVYNLTVKYLGDDTYLPSSQNITLTVYGLNATASTNFNSSKKGEVKVNVIIGNETQDMDIAELSLNVTYKNGNDTIVINVTEFSYNNGTLYFTLENANFTSTAILNIRYKNTDVNVTLNRIYNAKIEIINSVNEYKTGNFTFRLVDVDDGSYIAGKSIKLTTVGNVRAGFSATTDSNGIATFKTVNLYEFNNNGGSGTINLDTRELVVGDHSVDLETEGNVKASKVTTNLTITPANIKIAIDPYKEYYGSTKSVTMKVTNSLNEAMAGIILKLTIKGISGTYYLQTNSSGIAQIAIYSQSTKRGLVGGDYEFTVSNNDTTNIKSASDKETIHVVKIPVTITAKDKTVSYNTGTTSTITVKDKNGKAVANAYILVIIDKNTKEPYLFQTNSKGQISLSASLAVGKHKLTISCVDNIYSAKDVTQTITVKKASAKITAKKVTDYYKGAKYLTVKLTNTKNKKPIYDGQVSIKIFVTKNKYYPYKGKTGMNGKIKLPLYGLKPGKYKVEITGASSKNFDAKKVTTKIVIKKATAKFTPKKLTAKKGAKKYFKVTVKNKKTKKVIKGVKVKIKVYTGKKAKTYNVKTNAKGIAKLSVKKLKVGKHKVVITSANKYVKAKKAKSTIKIKK